MLNTLDRRMNLEKTGEAYGETLRKHPRGFTHGLGVSGGIREAAYRATREVNGRISNYIGEPCTDRHVANYRPCETLTADEYARRVKAERR